MAMKKRSIDVIGVPVDLGAGRRGVDMGPSAIRVADLEARLESLGHRVQDLGDIDVTIPETQKIGEGKLKYKASILKICDDLRKMVQASLSKNRLPLEIGRASCRERV